MSPIAYLCPGRKADGRICGRQLSKPGRCAEHRRQDQQRRLTKQNQQGTARKRWVRLRAAVKARDDYTCQRCGCMEDLTVHLAVSLRGQHDVAEMDDCLTLCRSCHGAIDGPRASLSSAATLRGGRV